MAILGKNTELIVSAYQKIILPLLQESFDERESENLYKYVLEEFFQKRYLDVQKYELNEEETEDLTAIFQKLADHYPVQYVFNRADFYGLKLFVDESVLIPRPETEELLHWILEENKEEKLAVLDIGTGSGCIPVALKKNRSGWEISAIDISEKALEIAKKNAVNNNVDVEFIQYDIFNQLSTHNSQLSIIISNPPYIPFSEQNQMSASAILFEPEIALFVQNDDPLVFYERIADFALTHLQSGGKLYFELNEFNATAVVERIEKKGFTEIILKQDLQGKNRMLRCKKP